MPSEAYAGREQTLVKHAVLAGYLGGLASKLAQSSASGVTLNYVDGFSGPWKGSEPDLSDTSPGIALRVLDDVRARMQEKGRRMRVRCLFIEKEPDAHAELRPLCAKYPHIETVALRGAFDDHIERAADFVRQGPQPFGFVFIDPTGWTGFRLAALRPVFGPRTELLVNFMTSFLARFLDHSPTEGSRFDLFDGDEWKTCARLEALDRDDCLVATYCRAVERVLGFRACCHIIVLRPEEERTQYHLVYASNSMVGLELFRNVERRAMAIQGQARGAARRRRQEREDPTQGLLLPPADWQSTSLQHLARRYEPRAKAAVDALLSPGADVEYDTLLAVALRHPLTSRRQLNDWLRDRQEGGGIDFIGLKPSERIPKPGHAHRVRVRTQSTPP